MRTQRMDHADSSGPEWAKEGLGSLAAWPPSLDSAVAPPLAWLNVPDLT